MTNLAWIYSSQGKWNKAEQLEVEVLDMRKKLLGSEHLETLRSMADLATTYSNQGKWNELEQLEAQVLGMKKYENVHGHLLLKLFKNHVMISFIIPFLLSIIILLFMKL
jgi:hypothetical protein